MGSLVYPETGPSIHSHCDKRDQRFWCIPSGATSGIDVAAPPLFLEQRHGTVVMPASALAKPTVCYLKGPTSKGKASRQVGPLASLGLAGVLNQAGPILLGSPVHLPSPSLPDQQREFQCTPMMTASTFTGPSPGQFSATAKTALCVLQSSLGRVLDHNVNVLQLGIKSSTERLTAFAKIDTSAQSSVPCSWISRFARPHELP